MGSFLSESERRNSQPLIHRGERTGGVAGGHQCSLFCIVLWSVVAVGRVLRECECSRWLGPLGLGSLGAEVRSTMYRTHAQQVGCVATY
eukprot:7096552-Prymnesium_polylepis.1